MSFIRKIWGKNETDYEDAALHQIKDKGHFQIDFQNYENPQKSFSINSDNPLNVYFAGDSNANNTPFYKDLDTEFIMEPKQREKLKSKYFDSELCLSEAQESIISEPSLFSRQNKNAYVLQVDTNRSDFKRPDLEFVIYIPIDTAVKWLTSAMDKKTVKDSKPEDKPYKDKKPEYISEQPSLTEPSRQTAVIKTAPKEIKYGVERHEEDENTEYMIIKRKSQSKSDSDESESEEEDDKNQAQPSKLKDKKVKGPKKVKKKARRIVTTYVEDDDSIDLGRLRPKKQDSGPVKIISK